MIKRVSKRGNEYLEHAMLQRVEDAVFGNFILIIFCFPFDFPVLQRFPPLILGDVSDYQWNLRLSD